MDFLAGAFELIGLYLTGHKWKWCFVFNLLGCCTWIYYVLSTGNARGLLLVVIPAMVINVRNYFRWR